MAYTEVLRIGGSHAVGTINREDQDVLDNAARDFGFRVTSVKNLKVVLFKDEATAKEFATACHRIIKFGVRSEKSDLEGKVLERLAAKFGLKVHAIGNLKVVFFNDYLERSSFRSLYYRAIE